MPKTTTTKTNLIKKKTKSGKPAYENPNATCMPTLNMTSKSLDKSKHPQKKLRETLELTGS